MAHDTFNYGSFLWGVAMSRLTIPHSDAIIGAHLDNMIHNKGELDSKDDQKSIKAGYDWNRNR
jgi:hypothetical protein